GADAAHGAGLRQPGAAVLPAQPLADRGQQRRPVGVLDQRGGDRMLDAQQSGRGERRSEHWRRALWIVMRVTSSRGVCTPLRSPRGPAYAALEVDGEGLLLAPTALRAVLEGLPDATVAADANLRIVFANALAEELFGRADLVGQPLEVIWPERVRARYAHN